MEEAEGLGSGSAGAEATEASSVDPIAVGLALAGASREKADAFLDDQRAFLHNQSSLIDVQKHHLHEQFKHLHLSVWEKRLGVLLRVATAAMGLGIAAGLGVMIWSAAHSNGLVIEPFSVPPDLAQSGLTGQVVAAKLLDRLSEMQAQANSQRPARTYANNWSESGIKLEIPETGVSLVELDNFLRAKLGHDTHVTGEIVRTAYGVSLTARAGEEGAKGVIGSEADLDGLVQKSAEAIYELTQPFRYAYYLDSKQRYDEAYPIFERLVKTGSGDDRLYSYNRWAQKVAGRYGIDAGLRVVHQALAEDPYNMGAYGPYTAYLSAKSQPEEKLQAVQTNLTRLSDHRQRYMRPLLVPNQKITVQAALNELLGDFHDASQAWAVFARTGLIGFTGTSFFSANLARNETGEHDLVAARAAMPDVSSDDRAARNGYNFQGRIFTNMRLDSEAEDWTGVVSQTDAIDALVQKYPAVRSLYRSLYVPLLAYAQARLGKVVEADALIAPTPADCYDCLLTRARIAELRGQHARADWWFARAVSAAPSIPFAYSYWGQALLIRGDEDGAIAKFTIANQKGPKFADPLEMWGETLMLQKHPDLALAKFAEAEKYAPNWGRLHLKWGEALVYVGKKNEAKAQFARAAALDLTSSERAELARIAVRG